MESGLEAVLLDKCLAKFCGIRQKTENGGVKGAESMV